ncbi:UDP-N-acetylmuramate dehydrogenase [Bacteroidales bacterium OttesenSCG-928-K03]|nr:UDP-N-acetylmuramate dehydrogenase [Odoribacter sp. OttesenSCG-928-L07]MDL2239517.1 UDP-N-acetylmuramate dehydrogenase [Bacteroidales bacterium OttesenSCG-928-L14]MDL2243041.1 UDP-N-acetylmuramate dehydrogenase [Bacteroidales bacterium OttesenSCG-928-K03]
MINIKSNISLKSYNTFGVDANAKYFVEINTKDDLLELFENPIFQQEKHFILGSGANVIFSSDYEGIIIKSNINNIEIIDEDDENVYINVGSGVDWNDFISFAVEHSFSGIENLIGIPSQCGSAVVQNIGAYGMEVKDSVEKVFTVEMFDEHNVVAFNNEDCKFSYRSSIFKEKKNIGKYYITNIVFRLRKSFVPCINYRELTVKFAKVDAKKIRIKDICNAVSEIRANKLPDYKICGNAGSFFKNPVVEYSKYEKIIKDNSLSTYKVEENTTSVKLSAAQLIELTGLKGQSRGKVGVSKQHSLVLCNLGGASGQEIVNFSNMVISAVNRKFGVLLEPEIIVV